MTRAARYGQIVNREDIPAECIDDLTRPGHDASDNAKRWRVKLGFTIEHREDGEAFLRSTGIERERVATMDDATLAEYVLWVICNDFNDGDRDVAIIE